MVLAPARHIIPKTEIMLTFFLFLKNIKPSMSEARVGVESTKASTDYRPPELLSRELEYNASLARADIVCLKLDTLT
jgi:hypothetical protein